MNASLVAFLITSHAVLAASTWQLSRRHCLRDIRRTDADREALEAENALALARLCTLRDQLKDLETSVIRAQLMLEEAQE